MSCQFTKGEQKLENFQLTSTNDCILARCVKAWLQKLEDINFEITLAL